MRRFVEELELQTWLNETLGFLGAGMATPHCYEYLCSRNMRSVRRNAPDHNAAPLRRRPNRVLYELDDQITTDNASQVKADTTSA
ncbi:jg17062 [Pararge aegeria aegeria]|uniref:Jg17062 protein n=1 Tax=Pararge aegeria aegeria TaxID=348720 RepID=A0A8S4R3J3_9NEOP|nr:jg17062 [Pararge aegeria aegeria]